MFYKFMSCLNISIYSETHLIVYTIACLYYAHLLAEDFVYVSIHIFLYIRNHHFSANICILHKISVIQGCLPYHMQDK